VSSVRAARVRGLADLVARPGASLELLQEGAPAAGSFEVVDGRSFCFACPRCGALAALTLGAAPCAWFWNGSEAAPSLSPALFHAGCWHGWLRGGYFEGTP